LAEEADEPFDILRRRQKELRYFSGLGLLSTHLITPTILGGFKLGKKLGIS
jgi:hypothetical protein